MDNVPIVLGQYRLGKTLGIGAFGKVKSKWTILQNSLEISENDQKISLLRHLVVITSGNKFGAPLFSSFSGSSYYHGSEGRRENSE